MSAPATARSDSAPLRAEDIIRLHRKFSGPSKLRRRQLRGMGKWPRPAFRGFLISEGVLRDDLRVERAGPILGVPVFTSPAMPPGLILGFAR